MTSPIQLQTSSGRSLQVELKGRVTGGGRLSPFLVVPLAVSHADQTLRQDIRLLSVNLELSCRQEIVADASVTGVVLFRSNPVVMPRLRTTPSLLRWVTDSMGSRGPVHLAVRLHGAVQFRDSYNDPWIDDEIPDNGGTSGIEISRSDWNDHVITTTQQEDFVYLEVGVPRHAPKEWQAALSHLGAAQASFDSGDDASAFQRLRAVLDALPGAKKDIYAAITDPGKQAAIDKLTRDFGSYLHLGRHVAAVGSPEAGSFPVDHVDAEFALAATKVLLSYASRIMPRS